MEEQHPRLCKLIHITIAILLSLPVDPADLTLSARIFVEVCKDMHLYIATPKTFMFWRVYMAGLGSRAALALHVLKIIRFAFV